MGNIFAKLATVLLLTALVAPALWSCNTETASAKALREHTEQYKAIDDTLIRGYLNRNHITDYTRTESGLYLINTTNGTGPFISTGNQVAVRYIGRLLGYAGSGQIFENSNDNRTPCRCGNFTVGQQIAGWNEGLQLMQLGSRKTLLIPSYMAYGYNGSGTIGRDQPLSFEMEIVSVSR